MAQESKGWRLLPEVTAPGPRKPISKEDAEFIANALKGMMEKYPKFKEILKQHMPKPGERGA